MLSPGSSRTRLSAMAGEPVQNEGVGRELPSFRIDQNELEPCVPVPGERTVTSGDRSGRRWKEDGLARDVLDTYVHRDALHAPVRSPICPDQLQLERIRGVARKIAATARPDFHGVAGFR